ncbi:MAG: hypothetical protein O2948_09035 [Proteobacteria bacterium]|nr:hypothetical protein [Pseudomonadota bacterium]MDA0928771.1 hypothetical protein [Pseudomonadota bacterium]
MSKYESIRKKTWGSYRVVPHLLIASLTLLGSCTTESLYNMAQEVQRQRCEEQPIPTQEACKAQFVLSYDDYARERAALTQEEQ